MGQRQPRTLPAHFQRTAARAPDALALQRLGDTAQLTWREYAAQVLDRAPPQLHRRGELDAVGQPLLAEQLVAADPLGPGEVAVGLLDPPVHLGAHAGVRGDCGHPSRETHADTIERLYSDGA